MIRKHVKVEPGPLVHALRPARTSSSGRTCPAARASTAVADGTDISTEPNGEAVQPESEARLPQGMAGDHGLSLLNHPCIGVWVPFNEAWGQFETAGDRRNGPRTHDPHRVWSNSGQRRQSLPRAATCSTCTTTRTPKCILYDVEARDRARRIRRHRTWRLEGHLWEPDRNWGYVQFQDPGGGDRSLSSATPGMLERHDPDADSRPAVYTQTTRRGNRGERTDDLRPEKDQDRRNQSTRDQPSDLPLAGAQR